MSPGNNIGVLIIILFIKVCEGGEYCTSCNGEKIYCDSGCCGSTCCPNVTAIVVGTVVGTLIVAVAFGAFVLCLIQRRRSKYSRFVNIDTQTETDDIKYPSKDGNKTPPPQPRPPPTNFADILNEMGQGEKGKDKRRDSTYSNGKDKRRDSTYATGRDKRRDSTYASGQPPIAQK